VGLCHAGTQICNAQGTGYGACVGEVVPTAEICDGLDNNCNNQVDDGACTSNLVCLYDGSYFCGCTSPFANCSGTCTDLTSNSANCGFCGHVCFAANGNAVCNNGTCRISSCNAGFGDCDGLYATGCEVNTRTDVNHCGACNVKCSVGEQCVNGGCRQANGTACATSSQCASWFCVDGVCCDSACTGVCQACSAAK
jgi:hypothetical protein